MSAVNTVLISLALMQHKKFDLTFRAAEIKPIMSTSTAAGIQLKDRYKSKGWPLPAETTDQGF